MRKTRHRQGEGATARWFSRIGHHPAAELHSNSVFFSKMITIFCVVGGWMMTALNYVKWTPRIAILMPVGEPTVGSELLRLRGRYAHRCVYWLCCVIHWR